jgi:HEPN pEK499 p136
MEYDSDFARSFMKRTLALATEYEGPLDATLLVNCLLGLLIVPKEALIEKIPTTEFDSLLQWGIKPTSIKTIGRCEYGHEHNPNLRQLVRRLRNAVAHFRIEPWHSDGQVAGFTFRDRNGFHA